MARGETRELSRDEEGGDATVTRGVAGTVMVAMRLCSDDGDEMEERQQQGTRNNCNTNGEKKQRQWHSNGDNKKKMKLKMVTEA